MSRYLVVANQTATSSELVDRLLDLAVGDPEATFTHLVPATPVSHLLTWEAGETHDIARKRASEAAALFNARGLDVTRVEIGDSSPLLAIEDEIRVDPTGYDAIVLSTFPSGVSRWLGLDVHSQAERRFRIPVVHVVSQKPVAVG